MSAAARGRYFDDFQVGQVIRHATPRTITTGDVALYTALYGSRFALHSSDAFARAIGYPAAPVDDLLLFHVVFGKSVPDISLNAVANLGYAEGRFLAPVFPGDTISARSVVIGLRETSRKDAGIVYVRTEGTKQTGETVLAYVRWVLVSRRNSSGSVPQSTVPDLAAAVSPEDLYVSPTLTLETYDTADAGSEALWGDFDAGRRIDHVDGTTVEEAEHALATRLYQNTARVHFDDLVAKDGPFGRRIVYGGHVISVVRALSFNGLANAFRIAAVNGGRHAAPVFAGDTLYAWSEVLERWALPGRDDVGALRLRSVAVKNRPATGFPGGNADDEADAALVLDLDYTVLMPRRAGR